MPSKCIRINLNRRSISGVSSNRLMTYTVEVCKEPPDDTKFIYSLTVKGIRSRQPAGVKAYLVW